MQSNFLIFDQKAAASENYRFKNSVLSMLKNLLRRFETKSNNRPTNFSVGFMKQNSGSGVYDPVGRHARFQIIYLPVSAKCAFHIGCTILGI